MSGRLVLGADSRATTWAGDSARVASDYSQKLFAVSHRFGAATFGWGHLEDSTIAGAMPTGTVLPGASTAAGECGASWEGATVALTRLLPSCGGAAELLAITSRGRRWLQETKLRASLVRAEP